MRYVAGLFIVLALTLPGGAQSTKGKQKLANYYPLKPGTKWTYQVDNGAGGSLEISNQVSKNETIDGKSLAVLETVVNGNVVASEHLNSTPEGVFRCRYNGIEVSPPLCILKYPVVENGTWTMDTSIGAQKLKVKSVTGKFEEVTTPAGKYKAAPVVTETEVSGTKIKAKLWFVPDVGIVKQNTEIGDKVVNVVLVKFEGSK